MNPALRSSAAHVFDGETVTATDGAGSWRTLRVTGSGVAIDGDVRIEPAGPSLVIAAAVPKGDRLEWMVQKLTEVGVREIVLVDCARSVVRWDAAKAAKQIVRLERIAREASMQSRSVWRTRVAGPLPFADIAARPGVVLAEPGAARWAAGQVGSGGAPTVVIGPEGGFSPEELALVPQRVGLGDRILRVETAALVAAVLATAS